MDDDTNPTFVDVDDDVCSCDSVYHSLIDTLGGAQPPVPAAIPSFPSPIQTAFSTPEPDSLVLKDDRSYQRARQRLKKPDDISKAKRCVRCKFCRPWKSAGNEGRPKEKGRGLRASLADTEGKGQLEKSIELTEDDDHHQVVPVNRNVSLTDLVKTPRKGSDKRFEMIGRPRQVLVLDDFTETDPNKLDLEDWEHIEVEAKHRKAMSAPSYARVVANRA
ncbi:hypothetical protein JB92DRAFT_3138798 [Gautieria morchelliformis]|nr:hypothetical protein JB92DRAFT_3138798 [Gautieria morchelliformis]